MLEVGKDTYITLAEADQYIQDYYGEGSDVYQMWNDIGYTENRKEADLRRSAEALNNLKYRGRKRYTGQPLAFPRVKMSYGGIVYTPFVSQFYDNSLLDGNNSTSDDGLYSAGRAQIENVIAYKTLGDKATRDVFEKQVFSIRNKRAGSVSETYDSVDSRSIAVLQGIYNVDNINSILKSWVSESIQTL